MAQFISFNHIYDSLSAGSSFSVSRKQTKQFENEDALACGNLAKDLRDKCRMLAKSDYSSGASTNIMTKLAKFIDSYNKLVDESGNSSDRTVSKQLKNMQKLIEDNKAALKKAGINIEDDKKLKLNSEVLTKLKSDTKFKTLFGGSNSFITKFRNYSEKIYKHLKYQTINKDVTVTKNVSLTDEKRTQALNAGALFSDFNTLSSANYSENNHSSITNLLNTYINKYNSYLNASTDNKASLNKVSSINLQYSANLSAIGVTVNDDSSILIDEDKLNQAQLNDIKGLFEKNNPYADKTLSALNAMFSDIAGVAKEGLSVNISM